MLSVSNKQCYLYNGKQSRSSLVWKTAKLRYIWIQHDTVLSYSIVHGQHSIASSPRTATLTNSVDQKMHFLLKIETLFRNRNPILVEWAVDWAPSQNPMHQVPPWGITPETE